MTCSMFAILIWTKKMFACSKSTIRTKFVFSKNTYCTRNQIFRLKRSKFLRVPRTRSYYCLKFCAGVLLTNVYNKVLGKLFFFFLKNKTKKSTHRFLGIARYNTCANFREKSKPYFSWSSWSSFFLKKKTLFFYKEQFFVSINNFHCRANTIK